MQRLRGTLRAAIESATNRSVLVSNFSEHTGLTLPGLLDELPTLKDQLATADIIGPHFDTLFSEVAATRASKPTVLRAINRYNDYIGWPVAHLTPAQNRQTLVFLDQWNAMLCRSAEQHGFLCADVYHAFNGPDGSKAAGKLLAADYTHPSDEGNAKIAEILTKQGYKPVA